MILRKTPSFSWIIAALILTLIEVQLFVIPWLAKFEGRIRRMDILFFDLAVRIMFMVIWNILFMWMLWFVYQHFKNAEYFRASLIFMLSIYFLFVGFFVLVGLSFVTVV
jgi:hypothetical protein